LWVGHEKYALGQIVRVQKSNVSAGCVWVQCGSVYKKNKFGKRTKGLSEISNPEGLYGFPIELETEIK
jgi:hypothetical protein